VIAETTTTSFAISQPVTCTLDEKTQYTATFVNTTFGTKTITITTMSALGHLFLDYVSNDDATCLGDGTKTACCDHEGCTETNTIIELNTALGHFFSNYVRNDDATCTTDGTSTACCDHQGCSVTNTVTVEGSALGHSFIHYLSNNDATSTTDGTKTARCSRAGCKVMETITDNNSRFGHYFLDYVSNNDATCTVDGTKTAHCSVENCPETDTITDVGSAFGHKYNSIEYIWSEDYTSCIAKAKCSCDASHVLTETASSSSTIKSNASCNVGEVTRYTVTFDNTIFCTQNTTAVTSAPAGHTFSTGWTSDRTHHWHATSCGHSQLYQDKDLHTESDWIVDSEATNKADGKKHKECTVCGRVLLEEIIPRLTKNELIFATLTFDSNRTTTIKFDNDVTTYDFNPEISLSGNSVYVISTDVEGNNVIEGNIVTLKEGNNVVYIIEKVGKIHTVYTVTIRRRPFYTVQFDTKGGTPIDNVQVEEDKLLTITQDSTMPGYHPVWDYDLAKPVTSNLTLTATWVANTYTVQFDANQGTGSMTPQTFVYDDLSTLKGNTFTREDYLFAGWSTTEDGAIAYTDKHTVINLTGDYKGIVTFYAIWNANFYMVNFQSNDGSGEMNDQKITCGKEVVLQKNGYSKKGYYFIGWATSEEGEVEYGDEDLVSDLTTAEVGNCTLYAMWDIATYTITYELNNGTDNPNNPRTYRLDSGTLPLLAIYRENSNITLGMTKTTSGSNCDYLTDLQGYTFEGWYTESTFVNKVETVDVNWCEDVTLYAKWTEGAISTTLYKKVDDYYYFGSYPQTDVTEEKKELFASYVTLLPTHYDDYGWTSYNYYDNGSKDADFMWYKDIYYSDGNKYRAVYFISSRADNCVGSTTSNQETNGYTVSNVYWFRYDPIEWSYASIGTAAYLVSNLVLDCQPFDYDGTTSNNYAQSTIRAWLNDTFYDTAFTEVEKALVNILSLDNGASSVNSGNANNYLCGNTIDWVYLLNYSDLDDTKLFPGAAFWKQKPTAYAKAQGIKVDSNSYSDWLTRSPHHSNSTTAWSVTSVAKREGVSTSACSGIVPAILFKLEPLELANAHGGLGSISSGGNKTFGESVTTTATPKRGYALEGWYSGITLLSTETTFTYTAKMPVTARFKVADNMSNFIFTTSSDNTYCGITGIKDNTVTEIIIPECVTAIESNAFVNCTALKKLSISSGLTAYYVGALKGCTALESIVVDSKNIFYYSEGNCLVFNYQGKKSVVLGCKNSTIPTTIDVIEKYAFYDCTTLTTINLPNSVKDIKDYAFSGCTALTNVTMSGGIKTLGDNSFYHCGGIASVNLPEGLTKVGKNCFAYCGLKSLTIPSTLTSIDESAFAYNEALITIDFPSTTIALSKNCFIGCTSIISLSLPGTLTTGQSCFENCTGVKTLTLGSNLTTLAQNCFAGCTGLTAIDLNDVKTLGVRCFSGCTGITSLVVPENTTFADYCFADCTGLTSLTLPSAFTSLGNYCFSGCSGLTAVTVSTSYAISKGTFKDCTGIKSLNVPQGAVLNDESFSHCSGITSLTLNSNITLNGKCFEYCSGITSLTIPTGITFNASHCFANCTGLTTLTLTSGATIGNYCFSGCTGIKNQTIPANIVMKSYCFENCTGITSLTLSSSSTIAEFAFANCTGLTTLTIPDNVNLTGFCFDKCSGLTTVTFQGNKSKIGKSCFRNCTKLSKIEGEFASIDIYALVGTSSLKSFVLPDSCTYVGSYTFDGSCLASLSFSNKNNILKGYDQYAFRSLPSGITLIFRGTAVEWYSIRDNYSCCDPIRLMVNSFQG